MSRKNEQVERVSIAGQAYDRSTVWEDAQHNQVSYRLPSSVAHEPADPFHIKRALASGVMISLLIMTFSLVRS